MLVKLIECNYLKIRDLCLNTASNQWFDEIENALAAPTSTAVAMFWSGQGTIESMILGILNILLARSCSPEDLFAAQARLLRVRNASPWFKDIGEVICRIIERAWERTFESPSLLRTPRFSVPRIRAACSGAGVGLQKVARILLAARDAVFVKLPPEIQSEIEQLAE